jgi:hypothetical protein
MMEGVVGGDKSYKEDTPDNSEVKNEGHCFLEVLGKDDDAAVLPVGIAQHLTTEK